MMILNVILQWLTRVMIVSTEVILFLKRRRFSETKINLRETRNNYMYDEVDVEDILVTKM